MKKVTNTSRRRLELARKRVQWQDKLFSEGKIVKKPVSLEILEMYGERFIEFCQRKLKEEDLKSDTPLPFYLEDFMCEEGIPWNTMDDWRKRSSYLEECIQFGFNTMLGIHQEKGVAIRKFAEKGVHLNLADYLPRWKQAQKRDDDRRIAVQGEIQKAAQPDEHQKERIIYHGFLTRNQEKK